MLLPQDIFARIEEEDVDLIWRSVPVSYDNALQLPLSFRDGPVEIEITELIGSFRDSPEDPSITYLVRTKSGIFSLYLTFADIEAFGGQKPMASRWILHCRICEKESPMLVDMKLKRLADFHGHLCPELVIGYRACLLAQAELAVERLWQPQWRVIMENTSSALDAVQMLTGCTLGNGRLTARDLGRHVYIFLPNREAGLRLEAKPAAICRSAEFLELDRLVEQGKAHLSEITRYWAMVNRQVSLLLSLGAEQLFTIERSPGGNAYHSRGNPFTSAEGCAGDESLHRLPGSGTAEAPGPGGRDGPG